VKVLALKRKDLSIKTSNLTKYLIQIILLNISCLFGKESGKYGFATIQAVDKPSQIHCQLFRL